MSAAVRWQEQMGEWAIPAHVLEQAPASPWAHDTTTFAVDDTLDRTALSAEVARAVLPRSGGSVLDVGCGGGRAAMSLVPPAERVIGVDESAAMLAAFTQAAADAGVRSMTIQGVWPDVAIETPVADVVTCHHVAYNVAEIEPFIGALTGHARLAVVLVLPSVHPQSAWSPAWKHFWDLDRPLHPTSDDFGVVLAEMGIEAERWEMPRPSLARGADDPATRVRAGLRRLCLGEDRFDEMAAFLEANEPPWPMVHTVYRWPGDAPT
jgi:SAM-dependent methyltransferase